MGRLNDCCVGSSYGFIGGLWDTVSIGRVVDLFADHPVRDIPPT